MKAVAVTGSSGFVAGQIVKDLLSKGYKVHGTVRSLTNKDAYKHLLTLPHHENLQLFEADNEIEGSFDKAFEGCSFVMHTASPFFHPTPNQSEEYLKKSLVNPAISGTVNCLKAALKSGVKKVVLTSSVAAIWGSQRQKNPNHVYTEEDWNDVTKIGYSYSKTYAEKAAWEFVKEHPELKLVTINPSFVLGPVISDRSGGESVEWIKMFFNLATITTSMVKNIVPEVGVHAGILSFVDVRTVSQAHIAAMEKEDASGRYMVANTCQQVNSQAAKILSEEFPQYNIPTKLIEGQTEQEPLQIANDHSRAEKELGVVFYPWRQTLVDMVNSLIEKGTIPKKN